MSTQFPPTLAVRQDSKYFSSAVQDIAVKAPMEGGYVTSRPRTTRLARRMFTTGFTDVDQAFKDEWDTFIREVGTYEIVLWTNPVSQEVISVRLESIPVSRYRGFGGNHRYDIPTIRMIEA